jgi:hypothetical protein
VDEFDETVEDVRAAFDTLRAAGSAQPQQRRALRAVLNELYRLQEYRLGYVVPDDRGRANAGPYFARAASCDPGRTILGILYLRGVLTHHLTKPVEPSTEPLYPSATLYPGENVHPGQNLTWISGPELQAVHTPQDRYARHESYYIGHVGNHLVLPTIQQAIEFLTTDPVIVTMKYG